MMKLFGLLLQNSFKGNRERVPLEQVPEFKIFAQHIEAFVPTEPLKLGGVGTAVHAGGERAALEAEIAVELVAAEGLWNTRVDPNQLENALLNLCINARDAMPAGGQLTVETANQLLDEHTAAEHDLPPGQYVSLCVRDNGAGMSPDVAARAFDPFYTTKPLGAGTGLGLSMVYGFARQSGGQTRIYSRPGKGTRVYMYLPRRFGVEDPLETPSELVRTPRNEGSATVLVVDDEEMIRILVTEVLEDQGHIAIEAGDAATGLDLLQRNGRIDLLITDVGLPGGMNGRQLAEAARELQSDLKVLFISGYAEDTVLNHGILDTGMHVMTKPFAIEALVRRISDLVAVPEGHTVENPPPHRGADLAG